jgi:hypothetical protein
LQDSNRKCAQLQTELDECRACNDDLKRQLEEKTEDLGQLRRSLNDSSAAPDTAAMLNEKDEEITRKHNLIEELKAIHQKDLAQLK